MKKILTATILAGMLFHSCTSGRTNESTELQKKVREVNKVDLNKIGVFYQKPSTQFPTNPYKIWDHYNTQNYKFTSVEDARLLFCKVFEKYLNTLNDLHANNPDLFLNPPVNGNFEVMINFLDSSDQILQTPYISAVHNNSRDIIYRSLNVEERQMKEIHRESIETGFNIYLQSKKT